MLSVTEAASILNISGARVRKLIQDGVLPAHKVGSAWVLREEDVLQRKFTKPAAGRPTQADSSLTYACCEIPSNTQRRSALHDLYVQSKELFTLRPSAEEITAAPSKEEASFYLAVADFFLQQKQQELIEQGVY